MTSKQLGDLLAATGQPRIRRPDDGFRMSEKDANAFMEPSKYRAVRTVDADGNKWDSKAELRRWEELIFLQDRGLLSDLKRQPRFDIVMNGVHCAFYKADFEYIRDGRRIIEDVKGMRTPVYRLKKKLVEAQYGIKITEITQ